MQLHKTVFFCMSEVVEEETGGFGGRTDDLNACRSMGYLVLLHIGYFLMLFHG